MAALRGEVSRPDPGIDEQYDIITLHYRAMLDHYGEMTGVNMARKHLGWYVKGLPGSAEFRNQVNQIPDSKDVLDALARFYGPFLSRAAASPRSRRASQPSNITNLATRPRSPPRQ